MKGIGVHPAARMKMPTMPHIGRAPKPTTKVHFSAHNNVRLPQGLANTKAGDPGVYSPDIGKI